MEQDNFKGKFAGGDAKVSRIIDNQEEDTATLDIGKQFLSEVSMELPNGFAFLLVKHSEDLETFHFVPKDSEATRQLSFSELPKEFSASSNDGYFWFSNQDHLDNFVGKDQLPKELFSEGHYCFPLGKGNSASGCLIVLGEKKDHLSQTSIDAVVAKARIADLKLENLRLKKSLKRAKADQFLLRIITSQTQDAVVVTNIEGEILWVNESFEQMTEFAQEEVLGKVPGHILQGPNTSPESKALLRDGLQRRVPIETTIVNYTKSGIPYDVYLKIAPVFDEDGLLTNFVAVQRDISSELEANRNFIEEKIKLEGIVKTLPDQIFLLNKDGEIKDYFTGTPKYVAMIQNQPEAPKFSAVIGVNEYKIHLQRINDVLSGKELPAQIYEVDTPQGKQAFESRLNRLDENRAIAVIRDVTSEIDQRKAQKFQAEFYKLLSDWSSNFIVSDTESFNSLLSAFLADLCVFFKVDSGFIYEYRSEAALNTHKWCKNLEASKRSETEHIDLEQFPWWKQKLSRNEVIHVSRSDNMPEEAASEAKLLTHLGVKSMVALPLALNKHFFGFFGIEQINHYRTFSDLEISLLKLAGEVLCNALSRQYLESEKTKFSMILESAAFGAILVNKDDTLHSVNPYMAELLEVSQDDLIDKPFSSLFKPGDQKFPVSYDSICERGSKEPFELIFFNALKRRCVLLTSAVCIHDQIHGKLVAYSIVDITDRKERETEINEALQLVSDQNKRLLNFSYIVSHNIRSHASNIMGIGRILSQDKSEESRDHFIEALVKSSNSLDSTLRHLNELLNIQTRVNIQKEAVYLQEVVERTIQILDMDIQANKVIIDTEIPEAFELNTDLAYIDSIIFNLLSNAIKYRKPLESPKIQLTCGIEDGFTWFSVKDNGMGIDLARFGERLFGMFKTFHGNKDARGIGLFITKSQIEALGGRIEVHSEVNIGTSFKVFLPQVNK